MIWAFWKQYVLQFLLREKHTCKMAHGNSQQKYCKQRVAQTAVVDLVIEYCMLWGDVMQSQSYAQAGDRKPYPLVLNDWVLPLHGVDWLDSKPYDSYDHHMTIRMSYRDTVFVQAQPAWSWFSFVMLHVCLVTGYGDLDQARRGGIGADMEQSHHWSQVQHDVTGHSYHLNTLYPAPWKSVQNSSRSLESRADLSCATVQCWW